jgi:TM2 domain-containing membrane protein YozV
MKACPFCAEDIQDAALVCKHCGRSMAGDVAVKPARTWSPGVAAVMSFFIPGLGHLYKGRVLAGVCWFVFTIIGYMMMIVPGIALHLFVIYEAYNGPSKDELSIVKVGPTAVP